MKKNFLTLCAVFITAALMTAALVTGTLCFPGPAQAGQTITINADVDGNVYGNGNNPDGTASDPDALDKLLDPNNNTVIINSGTVKGDVIGGEAVPLNGSAAASGNSVTINGGSVNGDVLGGEAKTPYGSDSGTASNNIVTINGGSVSGIVTGGSTYTSNGSATASGNSVTISGGSVKGDVIGGEAISGSGTETASNNTVTISGSPNLSAALLKGGVTEYGSGTSTGNTLNLHDPIHVLDAQDFQNINFYMPESILNGANMLAVTNTTDITGVTVNLAFDGTAPALAVNDVITLIDNAAGAFTAKEVSFSGYKFALSLEGGGLTAKVTEFIYAPVTNITGIPAATPIGTDVVLAGTVVPEGATNKMIVWSVKDAGTTGAALEGNILKTSAAGTVVVTAAVKNGATVSTPYTQDFTITVGEQTPEPDPVPGPRPGSGCDAMGAGMAGTLGLAAALIGIRKVKK